jgi:hypothetical protein
LGLPPVEVWLAYVGLGGNGGYQQVCDYLAGGGGLPAGEVTRLATALNEEFMDRGQNHPVTVDAEASWPELSSGPVCWG